VFDHPAAAESGEGPPPPVVLTQPTAATSETPTTLHHLATVPEPTLQHETTVRRPDTAEAPDVPVERLTPYPPPHEVSHPAELLQETSDAPQTLARDPVLAPLLEQTAFILSNRHQSAPEGGTKSPEVEAALRAALKDIGGKADFDTFEALL